MEVKSRVTVPIKNKKAFRAEVKAHLRTTAKEHLYKPTVSLTRLESPQTAPLPTTPVLAPAGAAWQRAEEPAAPPSSLTPAMRVEEFLNGDYLEPGDVILMTRLGSFFSWLMRLFDKSDFAHAALVFQTPRQTEGIDKIFLIETSMSGVEIVPLSDFLATKEAYAETGLPADFVIGVRRLQHDWSHPPHRRMAASRMLHFIQYESYNFMLLAALASQRAFNIFYRIWASFRRKAPPIGEILRKHRRWMPKQFICSGFVQYAFLDMVRTAYERGLISAEQAEQAMEDVIFSPNMTMQNEIEELMACTPKQLAYTDNLHWKYLIHKGDVFHVAQPAEVESFFKETLPKRRRNKALP